jgi:hypothetical protein
VLPSVTAFVTYEALGRIAKVLCGDIAGYLQASESAPAAGSTQARPVIYTALDLRNMVLQRNATKEHLDYARRKTDAALRDLAARPGGPTTLAIPSLLLGLDSISAVGKAMAGLAGMFKSDRTISSTVITIEPLVLRAAMLNCPRDVRIELVDPAEDVPLSSQVGYVKDLEDVGSELRSAIREARALLEADRTKLAAMQAEAEKPGRELAMAIKELTRRIAERERQITSAEPDLAYVETIVDKLYAVDEKTGISPVIALARMESILANASYQVTKDRPLLTLKVVHSSGLSQVSSAWWRNDRLYFAAGVAVAYSLQSSNGTVDRANVHYLQTPWSRLVETHDELPNGPQSFGR